MPIQALIEITFKYNYLCNSKFFKLSIKQQSIHKVSLLGLRANSSQDSGNQGEMNSQQDEGT